MAEADASLDVALVSLGTTPGLRRADAAFAEAVRAAGASCDVIAVEIGGAGRLRVQMALTDAVEALAARRAAREVRARAVVFSTVTAALFARVQAPYAVRFDAPAALNRPGAAGAWQRARERRVLAGARLLLPCSEAAAAAVRAGGAGVVTVPPPIEVEPGPPQRPIDAVAYAGNPGKRGLALLCAAWAAAAESGQRLVVSGIDRARALEYLERAGESEPRGVEWVGLEARARWLDRVRSARVFVNASRFEDFGIAPLEGLAAGTPLVTVACEGPYAALPLARELAGELVAPQRSANALAAALRAGLALEPAARADYARRATELLTPFRRETVNATVAERVLPALGIET